VIDANQYPLPEITDLAQRIRRIGLGVMGFADLLVRLGVPYNSEEGTEIGRRIMEFLDEEGKKESERAGRGARALPRVGALHLGARRDVRPRAQRRPHPSAAQAAQLQRDHGGAHRHHLHLRRLLESGSSRSSPSRSCATRPAR
jgi:hypothetical protein